MALKNFKSVTPSLRQYVAVDRSALWKGKPLKMLTTNVSEKSGRNNIGHITVRHKSAGHKKSYRIIDFKRDKFDIEAKVERIEYDPNRTAFIALVKYVDGTYSYILAPHKLAIGDSIISSKNLSQIEYFRYLKKVGVKLSLIIPLSLRSNKSSMTK